MGAAGVARLELEVDLAVAVEECRPLRRNVLEAVGGDVGRQVSVVLGTGFEGVDVTLGAQSRQQHGDDPDVGADVGNDGVLGEPILEQRGEIPLVVTTGALEFTDAARAGVTPRDGEDVSWEGPKGHGLVSHRGRRSYQPPSFH